MNSEHILIVDDEETLCEVLKLNLENEGYDVDIAFSAEQALMLDLKNYSLILLDIMMGEMSGIKFARLLKSKVETANIPIIFCTARDSEDDMIMGLNLGGDDYITRPYTVREKKDAEASIIEKKDIKLDCDSRRLFILGEEINLTAKEFDLLELLFRNENKVYSREKLLDLVWGAEYPGDVRTVDVHVRRLREKIEGNPSEPKYVHTKWGVGYYYSQK